jgi:hypothetical protein
MKITWNDADQRKVLSLIQRKDENILALYVLYKIMLILFQKQKLSPKR